MIAVKYLNPRFTRLCEELRNDLEEIRKINNKLSKELEALKVEVAELRRRTSKTNNYCN